MRGYDFGDLIDDVMGWSWVIGLGLAFVGTGFTGWVAIEVGRGATSTADCAPWIFMAAGLGGAGLLLFVGSVAAMILRPIRGANLAKSPRARPVAIQAPKAELRDVA